MSDRILQDVERLKQDFPKVTVAERSDGSVAVLVEEIPLPSWWEPRTCRVLLMMPPEFPSKQPAFYVSPDIRSKKTGQAPQGNGNANIDGTSWMTLCWSEKPWDPQRETLWRFLKHVQRRFHSHD